MNFFNNAGVPVILCSSLKPEGYLITGSHFNLRYVMRNGHFVGFQGEHNELNPLYGETVSFWAKDPAGIRDILLNGKKTVYTNPRLDCDPAITFTVTSKPKSTSKLHFCRFITYFLNAETISDTFNQSINQFYATAFHFLR